MDGGSQGKLILRQVPSQAVRDRIIELLLKHVRNTSKEKLSELLNQAPCTIAKNISQAPGEKMAEMFKSLGADTEFVPERQPDERIEETDAIRTSEDFHLQFIPSELQAPQTRKGFRKRLLYEFERINKELWLIFTMLLIVGAMNYLVESQRILLGLYLLPTIFSAYHFGRRHATLTALASICLVVLISLFRPEMLSADDFPDIRGGKWYELIAWGGILMVTAYSMGTLYERNRRKIEELQRTYRGLIVILRHFISKDKYTENHCYRVSVYAAKIASYLNLPLEQIEVIRAASMLHDLGKLKISRELLYKASQLTETERLSMAKHPDNGAELLKTVDTPLGRIIPIILAHHEKYDGSGHHNIKGDSIPLESRIITVADVYDALTSDRPYRKAMSPFEARDIIEKGSATEFDPTVVRAFLKAFKNREMDVPSVVV